MAVSCINIGSELSKQFLRIFERTSSQSPNDPRSTNARMHNRNRISQLALKRRIKIRAAMDRNKAVAVGQFCKDANVAVVFKLNT